jgi:hypothetical protein
LRRALAAAAALALALPGVAAAATVEVAEECYAEDDEIDVRGTGFTPNGDVRLALERASGEVLETSTDPVANAEGAVVGEYKVKAETGWFGRTQTRFDMTLRLTDQTDPTTVATTSFIFSRWNVGVRTVGGRIQPNRPAAFNAVGFTTSVGKPLYAHWLRNGRRVFSKRLGVLRGPCGDVKARLARGFPFRPVRRGSYQVRFTPSRTNLSRAAISFPAARVTRRIP